MFGWVRRFRDDAVRQSREWMIRDEMVSAINIMGSADEVRELVAERAVSVDAITPVVPQFGMPLEKAAVYRQRIADLFYG